MLIYSPDKDRRVEYPLSNLEVLSERDMDSKTLKSLREDKQLEHSARVAPIYDWIEGFYAVSDEDIAKNRLDYGLYATVLSWVHGREYVLKVTPANVYELIHYSTNRHEVFYWDVAKDLAFYSQKVMGVVDLLWRVSPGINLIEDEEPSRESVIDCYRGIVVEAVDARTIVLKGIIPAVYNYDALPNEVDVWLPNRNSSSRFIEILNSSVTEHQESIEFSSDSPRKKLLPMGQEILLCYETIVFFMSWRETTFTQAAENELLASKVFSTNRPTPSNLILSFTQEALRERQSSGTTSLKDRKREDSDLKDQNQRLPASFDIDYKLDREPVINAFSELMATLGITTRVVDYIVEAFHESV
jgi:hypothetical protein